MYGKNHTTRRIPETCIILFQAEVGSKGIFLPRSPSRGASQLRSTNSSLYEIYQIF